MADDMTSLAVFGTALRDRLLVRLNIAPQGLHMHELARQLGASPTAIKKATASLERTGMAVSQLRGRTRIVQLNRRWFAAKELRALLDRLALAYPDVTKVAETVRDRPRRIGKPL